MILDHGYERSIPAARPGGDVGEERRIEQWDDLTAGWR
jgi:hypothetical protein